MKYLSTLQTAQYVGVTPQAVVKAIHTKRINADRVGRAWLVRKDSKLEDWKKWRQ